MRGTGFAEKKKKKYLRKTTAYTQKLISHLLGISYSAQRRLGRFCTAWFVIACYSDSSRKFSCQYVAKRKFLSQRMFGAL